MSSFVYIAASFIVVLDANVLFPSSLRDTLLRSCKKGLYTMRCTEDILEEVQRNLVSKKKITEQQARHLMDTIRKQFPDAFVSDYKYLINSMANDPKDRHILAAAVACRAKVIVTNNLRDFPQSTLAPFEIEVQHPDDFLVQLFYLYPEFMVEIIEKQAKDLQRPPKTTLELLSTLNQHVPNFVNLIRASIL
jgi:predicted nucleic acid-binding protein